MFPCHCHSGNFFEICCKPFLSGKTKPATALQLMRSRYSAYVVSNIDYIIKTTHPLTRSKYDFDSLLVWSKSSIWIKLMILQVEKGTSLDLMGFVEFKAYFKENGIKSMIHHEYSQFLKEENVWYFLEGIQK
jgi:SEC-C motif domain protein